MTNNRIKTLMQQRNYRAVMPVPFDSPQSADPHRLAHVLKFVGCIKYERQRTYNLA